MMSCPVTSTRLNGAAQRGAGRGGGTLFNIRRVPMREGPLDVGHRLIPGEQLLGV